MGQITARIDLDRFHLHRQNDQGGADEPYVLVLYARIDKALNDPAVSATKREVPIHFPAGLGHGDLGSKSKGMSLSKGNVTLDVPSGIGHWETVLDSAFLDFSPDAMRNCAAAVGVVFMEEDSTLDSQVLEMLPELKKEVRRSANFLLRLFLNALPPVPANMPAREAVIALLEQMRAGLIANGFDPNGIAGPGLIDKVLDAVLPREIGKAIGKGFIPGAELWNLIAGIVQAADPDEYIGANGRSFTFYDLVGRAHAPATFVIDTFATHQIINPFTGEPFLNPETGEPLLGDNTKKGRYSINGSVRRTDSHEPPVLAAVRGPGERIVVFARRVDGDFIEVQRSDDFGKTFSVLSGTAIKSGAFRSGPGAASSVNGKIQYVAACGHDGKFRFSRSVNGGNTFTKWSVIPGEMEFFSAPAVALSPEGTHIFIVGRGADRAYWFTKSIDAGKTWATWKRIGKKQFASSASIVCLRSPASKGKIPRIRLMVAGLGSELQILTTTFSDDGPTPTEKWKSLSAGPKEEDSNGLTSAPSMSSDGDKEVLLVCRAANLRYWYANSFDGGETFLVGTVWQMVGKPGEGRVRYTDSDERRGDLQEMYSAPALVVSNDLEKRVFVGLSPTLGLWRNRCTRSVPSVWRSTTVEPEPDLRVHYY